MTASGADLDSSWQLIRYRTFLPLLIHSPERADNGTEISRKCLPNEPQGTRPFLAHVGTGTLHHVSYLNSIRPCKETALDTTNRHIWCDLSALSAN